MLKLAVIGAGVMGTNHARVASTLRDARLVAVVDGDRARAEVLAAATGAKAYTSVTELLDGPDVPQAAVVAFPTALHLATTAELVSAGVHILVEKPLASNVDDAREICRLARSAGVVLMVGHIERFNAVVLELLRLEEQPIHIEATRVGPFSARIGDGVIHDLMIHDLDLARALAKSEVTDIQAVKRSVRSETEDLCVALLTFANGVTATITASRLGQQKIRQLNITLPFSFITADLIRQDLSVNKVEHIEFLSSTGTRYRQTGVVEIPFLENRGEPLAAELTEFVRAVSAEREPLVTGEDGVEAIRLADLVNAAGARLVVAPSCPPPLVSPGALG